MAQNPSSIELLLSHILRLPADTLVKSKFELQDMPDLVHMDQIIFGNPEKENLHVFSLLFFLCLFLFDLKI